jgi:hypothetical protein
VAGVDVSVCCACGQDFNSVGLFDRHRVGRHAYSFAEGLNMDPPREDGRRCLDIAEMAGAGWRLNGRGRWIDPARDPRGRLRESRKLRKAVQR